MFVKRLCLIMSLLNFNRLIHSLNSTSLRARLVHIQKELNRNKSIHMTGPIDQMTSAQVSFKSRYFEPWTKELPVMVYGMPMQSRWFECFGNFMGSYFDSLSCAYASGIHFVGMKNFHGKHFNVIHEKFWDAFPDIILHHNPAKDVQTAILNIQKKCLCSYLCWGATDPWMDRLSMIRSMIAKAVYLHLTVKDKFGRTPEFQGLILDPDKDIFQNPINPFLPFIPDVAVHFRCSDNLYGGMGLLSFGTIIDRIPNNARTIYIFTEYGDRLQGTPLESAAPKILQALFTDVSSAYPNATVAIIRGGNVLDTISQLFLANVTICSASSFSWWPAIARSQTTYVPLTTYLGGKNGFHIFPELHWIREPKVFLNFTKDTPIQDIINTLRSDVKKIM